MLDKLFQSKKTKIPRSSAPNGRLHKNTSGDNGFHAKQDSSTGAARARSIGNRNTKPSKKK